MAKVPLRRDTDYVVIASREVNEVEFHQLVAWLGRAVGAEGET